MPRSGSTLVEQILASHPRVFGAGELGDVPEFFSRWNADIGLGPIPPRDQNEARARAGDFLGRLNQFGLERVTVKNLVNHLYLGVIATLLPGARIIYVRRNPLDVCLSCYFQDFQSADFAWSLEDIGDYPRTYEKMMDHWARALPTTIHEVRYEDLVHDQEAVTRDLLAYCDLDWDEHCLTFFQTRRLVRTASSVQVRQPISRGAIGRWKHYESHLGPLLQALSLSAAPKRAPAVSDSDATLVAEGVAAPI
jgi:hypothetical protein